jgi:hypothetical protein
MFIAISLLLLSLFALSFWILKESKVKLIVKLILITTFFTFCTLLGFSLQSFMGWSANDSMIPKVVAIRHVVIKEPNKQLGLEGSIHILIEHPPTRYDAWWLQLFAYKTSKSEPRLFRLPYSRELHETMQNDVIPKNMRGQIVMGELTKGKGGKAGFGKGGKGKGRGGKGKGRGNGNGEGEGDEDGDGNGQRREKGDGKGGYGGESLENEYMFHVLPPGYFQHKQAPE